jgi:BolA protein
MSTRTETIRNILNTSIQPQFIEVLDDSQAHAGHEGAKAGGGHFYLTIISDKFIDKSRIQRHQLIYGTLGDLMHNEIHALSIKAFTPQEKPQIQETK